jgi:nucleoside-diphosphate-sugar epimerase
MTQIAVTGAGGFIGSAVVRRLAADGHRVRALTGPPGAVTHRAPPAVECCTGEIDQLDGVAQLVSGCEVVVHLAGPASVAASFDAPAEFARVHVAGTATVLEASRRARVRRFIYVSSAEVYGAPELNPVAESHRLQARSPYAAAKIGAERLVECYQLAYGLPAIVLRPFSVYGPRQSASGVIARIVRQLIAGDALELADLSVVRDFCFVDDVADAIAHAATATEAREGCFNVASGVGCSIAELARSALVAVGADRPVRAVAAPDRPARADIPELIADTTRIRAALGWTSRTALVDGLRRMIHWFRTLEDA